MNKNDILFLFHSPYSAWGIRYRLTKLPKNNSYTLLLELCANAIEEKKLTSQQAKTLIDQARTGKIELAFDNFKKITLYPTDKEVKK
jgi:hypothetical protein